jgi:hypothetical protein
MAGVTTPGLGLRLSKAIVVGYHYWLGDVIEAAFDSTVLVMKEG